MTMIYSFKSNEFTYILLTSDYVSSYNRSIDITFVQALYAFSRIILIAFIFLYKLFKIYHVHHGKLSGLFILFE